MRSAIILALAALSPTNTPATANGLPSSIQFKSTKPPPSLEPLPQPEDTPPTLILSPSPPPTSQPNNPHPIRSPATTNQSTNLLQNPSFASGSLPPWTCSATGSWTTRTVSPNANGSHTFWAHTTSAYDATITLSQVGVRIPQGAVVECAAVVSAVNVRALFEVYLDATRCGGGVVEGGQMGVRIGGEVGVGGAQEGHVVSLVVVSYGVQGEGEGGVGVEGMLVEVVG